MAALADGETSHRMARAYGRDFAVLQKDVDRAFETVAAIMAARPVPSASVPRLRPAPRDDKPAP